MCKGHSFEQCTKKEKGKALAYLFGGFSLILSIWIPAMFQILGIFYHWIQELYKNEMMLLRHFFLPS